MSLAVQTKIGSLGSKATTELSLAFASMVNSCGFQYGANAQGLYQLNTGETDNGTNYARTVTFATNDFGVKNIKKCRTIFIGFEAIQPATLSVMADRKVWRSYPILPPDTGLQTVEVKVGSDGQGRYWTASISSDFRFRIDQVDGIFIVRPAGIRG